MNYIHLKSYHTNTKRFKHPLLKNVKSYSEEELNDMAAKVLSGDNPESLILALRGGLSMLVGRFIGNFNVAKHLDDMVSEGMTAITRLCNKLPADLVARRGILKVSTSVAQSAIENMLNSVRGLASAGRSKQFELINRDEEPIYLTVSSNQYIEEQHPEDNGDEAVRDILDAFSHIQPDDEIDIFLMDQSNWGRGYQELADDLGVGVATVHRRKQRLYQKYLRLTR